MDAIERAFHKHMLALYHQAKSEAGYTAHRFLTMLNEHGGLETARILLNASTVSDGYTALWERGRLDLTVEAVILEPQWATLFSPREREIAVKRLKQYGYEGRMSEPSETANLPTQSRRDSNKKWFVQLSGDAVTLTQLSEALNDAALTISRDGDDFVLSSSRFEDLVDAGDVRERAKDILNVLNGAARLALDSRESITPGAVWLRNEQDGKNVSVFPEPATIRVRAFAPTIQVTRADGTVEVFRPADPVSEWSDLALENRQVAIAFQIIAGGELDWVDLYKLFEVVESDAGGRDAVVTSGWAPEKAIRLFKHTANSPGAIGVDARHGARSNQPPPRPMALAEARALVTGVVHAWLRSKTVKRLKQYGYNDAESEPEDLAT